MIPMRLGQGDHRHGGDRHSPSRVSGEARLPADFPAGVEHASP